MTTWTLDVYTGQYDDTTRPKIVPAIGDTVAIVQTPDGREADAFRRRCAEAGVMIGDYIGSANDGDHDYHEIVADDYYD